MPKIDPFAQRISRLQDLVRDKYEGNKASLGKALGYNDGSYVGQLLSGKRPITEKTVDAIEKKTHNRGWFADTSSADQVRAEGSTGSNVHQIREPAAVWISEAMLQFWRQAKAHSAERREAVLGLVKELLKNEHDETQARSTCVNIERLLEPPIAPAAPPHAVNH